LQAVARGSLERVADSSSPLRVETLPTLAAAEDEWDSLAATNGNLFATFEWASAWWAHLADGASLRAGICRRADGSPAAILPLVIRRQRGVRIVRLLGHGPADRLAPICLPEDRPAVAEALRAFLGRSPADLFIGNQMPAEEGWGRALGAVPLVREASPVVLTDDPDWNQFLARNSRNLRQQVRRRERRLADRGRLRFRLSDRPDRLSDDLETLFELHERRWHRSGSHAFVGPLRRMHVEFANSALRRGWLRLWLLELDDRPLAAWYGFRFGGAEWFYQSGRDPDADTDSVGFVLLAHTIREALGDGVPEYRLLRGGEEYKSRFADGDPELETIALPLTVRGRAALAAHRLRSRALRALGRN
jgi:CelD/BcsL family acetyltransferase involved in cellulose biosynthesis